MGRKKAYKIDFKFSPWPMDVTRSKAWEQLTNPARVAYLHIRERWWFNRQQPVSVSYKSMERYMEGETFSKAIKQLEATRFIIETQTGGLFRRRNYYDMSEEWRKLDRTGAEIKSYTDGISIKDGQKHTVKSEKEGSTSRQMHTVNLSEGVGQ